MSISSELLTLNNTKTAIRTAINNKGGSVEASAPFASYATAIDNLPSGGDDSTLRDLIEGDITSITIPSGTTGIKAGAFQNCTSLTSITIPNTVTSIGDRAFSSCTSLTTLTIPSGVTTLGTQTFGSCGLTTLTVPNSVTTIPSYMVDHCNNLTKIIVGNNVSTIQSGAFSTSNENFVLSAIVINTTTVPNLQSTDAFNYTHNCPIYVPAESVDVYKAGYRWSDLASRIFAIEQVATVDGNPVYNYEIGNTSSTTIMSTEMAKLPTGTSIEFVEGITNMGGSISGYTTVTLPSTFATFNDQNMIGSSVTTLTMKSTTPPTAERNNLGGAGLTAIYVPASAVDTYKAASGWSNFASIIEGISSPSITITEFNEMTDNPNDYGDFPGPAGQCDIVETFPAASANSTFDSDIKAAGIIVVEDNNGNDITSQCTFTSNEFGRWNPTLDNPEYEGEMYYEWVVSYCIGDDDNEAADSYTITATYGGLTDTFVGQWTTTDDGSGGEEPEPEPEPDPEEPEE